MALTVTEASAVFDLLHWLGWRQDWGLGVVADDRAADALALLGQHAGKTLQITVSRDEAKAAIANMAGPMAGANSDGHAQAVCQAIAVHLSHNGGLPWPSIRRPYDEWADAHQRAEAAAL
jgi:hypothetical protein